ncbi:SPW repeat protein [Pontibacter brevis]
MLDYIVGPLLMVSPWWLEFNEDTAATVTAVIAGVVVLLQTATTDFEVGIVKKASVSTHLMTDVFLGIILAISPWPFGFNHAVYLPHLIFGLYFILVAFTTHRRPGSSYQDAQPEYGGEIAG